LDVLNKVTVARLVANTEVVSRLVLYNVPVTFEVLNAVVVALLVLNTVAVKRLVDPVVV